MQQRFVSIWFPYLVTDWHARKQPALRTQPFVLKAMERNRMVVTAANPLARAQGIGRGMVLADARALCPALQVLDDKPNLATQLTGRIAEWCIRFTPAAAADDPDGVLLNASGCAHLWGGEEAYVADVTQRLTQRGYTVRVAIADTIGCAWAVARYGKATVVASGALQSALLPLPVQALRLEAETIAVLHKLGLRKVKDILHLSPTSLRRRFGSALLQRLRQALGQEEEYFTPVYAIEPYQERLPCIEPIKNRGGVERALQALLAKLSARLCAEGKGLRKAFFRAYRLDGGTSGIEISTHAPVHNAGYLFQLFSIRLASIEPGEGIELFLLEAGVVEEASTRQEALWQTQTAGIDATVLALMDRFANKFGAGAVQRFLPTEHYWPERSFKATTDLNEDPATEWRLSRPRPMQLLIPPELIEVAAPIPDYPPLHFRHRGQLHKVVKADGPERIEQEWWIQEGEHRDYYAVEDEEGKRYWLFRSGHYNAHTKPKWYLHGYFA